MITTIVTMMMTMMIITVETMVITVIHGYPKMQAKMILTEHDFKSAAFSAPTS